jgi:hypothetical protein
MTDCHTSPTNTPAEPVKDMVQDFKAEAGVTDDVNHLAKEQAAQMGETGKGTAGNASGKMQNVLREQKGLGADYIDSLAQATERAAAQFEQASPQAASYIRQASGHIQGVAEVVRERDVRELVGEIENFARRQPTVFFGGAVILGVAAIRFLKSSRSSAP